jgi:pyridoxine 5-phosphate synthase
MKRPLLGVNVDHVATLRQARGTMYPDPVTAALLAESAGADQITVHLREDRRHIQDRDVRVLREVVQTRLNLEIAATSEMLAFAISVRPDMVTIVPERREERTTEGGLDVLGATDLLTAFVAPLREHNIVVSLFVDPDRAQLDACAALGIPMVELHTGDYAEARGPRASEELTRLGAAARHGHRNGLVIAAGHGLEYRNVRALTAIEEIVEYNIGHAIVARAVFVGFERAVAEMLEAMGK